MKARHRTVCHPCRSHKIGCSGQHPICSQCAHMGRQCVYPSSFAFVSDLKRHRTLEISKTSTRTEHQQLPRGSRPRGRGERSLAKPPCIGRHMHASPNIPLENMVLFIMQNFMPQSEVLARAQNKPSLPRICGNWVEVLPMLTTGARGEALPFAISTLAASISDFRQSSHSSTTALLGTYGSALQALRTELERPCSKITYRDELAAAIMCLALTEMLIPSSTTGWWRHVEGIGEWLQILGPESLSLGLRHKLFIGFRPLLVLKALMSRKSTFLSSDDWRIEPFQHQPATPMQTLLSEASGIASLLELIDILESGDPQASTSVASEVIEALRAHYGRLQTCGSPKALRFTSTPLYWRVPAKSRWAWNDSSIWFPSVTFANLLIHCWAFEVVCLVEMEKLRVRFPRAVYNWDIPEGSDPRTYIRETYLQLSTNILQAVEFLLQDEFALFGPFSIIFPLTMSWQTFKMDGERSSDEFRFATKIFEEALCQDFHMKPIMFSDILSL